jgi:uncharacterized protein YbaP (TraB family)
MHNRKLALAAFLVFGTAAEADDPPVTDWTDVETVVVTAPTQAPAVWHIKKGDAEIFLIGMPGPTPAKLAWNRKPIADLVAGAREVLTPAEANVGPFEGSWFLLTHRGLLSLPDDQKLEETLPPDLKARFAAARTALTLDADHFDDDTPILAAWKLQANFNEQHKLGPGALFAIRKIASDKDVPMHPVGEYGALGMLKELMRLPQDQQCACLAASIGDLEARTVHAGPEAEAWAIGDIKALKAHYTQPAFAPCFAFTAGFGKYYSRAVADYLNAIDKALSQPGKTVMLVEIGALLRNTGVVEKLRAKGITIEGPAE